MYEQLRFVFVRASHLPVFGIEAKRQGSAYASINWARGLGSGIRMAARSLWEAASRYTVYVRRERVRPRGIAVASPSCGAGTRRHTGRRISLRRSVFPAQPHRSLSRNCTDMCGECEGDIVAVRATTPVPARSIAEVQGLGFGGTLFPTQPPPRLPVPPSQPADSW